MSEELLEGIKKFTQRADNALNSILEKRKDIPESARYILMGGGKRIRATLVYAVAEHYGTADERSDKVACALEMIHAYSLIHDDLPCMDDDDFRRNKPSCHKVYGEAEALLAGDGLLTLAFEILFGDYTPGLFKAGGYIARCAGFSGMVGGQYMEITDKVYNEETLGIIDKGKTCALICAAILGSAYAVKEDLEEKEAELWERFAGDFGMAFQLKDDLLDISETDEGGPSFVAVCGKEKTEELLYHYTNKCYEALTALGEKVDGIIWKLVEFNAERAK